MSFLDRVRVCAVFDARAYLPFCIAGETVGLIGHVFAEVLSSFTDVFSVTTTAVSINPSLTTPAARTRAVDAVLRHLTADGRIPGWRDEPYPVARGFAQPPLMELERAAVPLFGVRAFGIHVNGFVRGDKGLAMWIGKRGLTRPIDPGKLDQLVAGGQPAGLSLAANLIKEAAEEAAIPAALVATAVPVGAITYRTERSEGLRRDTVFVFDLELPSDFRPRNTDGEIAAFELWPIERVAATVADTEDFKFNCALVAVDFLIRHGLIRPEHPDYLDLIAGLHSD